MGNRILILDDDNDILEVMQEALSYENYEVNVAKDMESFFSLIHNSMPDLVIIDYLLRGINGGEICHQLKTKPETADIPVFIMSAYPRVFESIGNYGCDEFIAKPFDLFNLIDRINSYMLV